MCCNINIAEGDMRTNSRAAHSSTHVTGCLQALWSCLNRSRTEIHQNLQRRRSYSRGLGGKKKQQDTLGPTFESLNFNARWSPGWIALNQWSGINHATCMPVRVALVLSSLCTMQKGWEPTHKLSSSLIIKVLLMLKSHRFQEFSLVCPPWMQNVHKKLKNKGPRRDRSVISILDSAGLLEACECCWSLLLTALELGGTSPVACNAGREKCNCFFPSANLTQYNKGHMPEGNH